MHGCKQTNEEDPKPQDLLSQSVSRTPVACKNCSATKTKCDREFPCGRCAERNLNCTLRPVRRRAAKMERRVGESLQCLSPALNDESATEGNVVGRNGPRSETRRSEGQPYAQLEPYHGGRLHQSPALTTSSPGANLPSSLPTAVERIPSVGTAKKVGDQAEAVASPFSDTQPWTTEDRICDPLYMMMMDFGPSEANGPKEIPFENPQMNALMSNLEIDGPMSNLYPGNEHCSIATFRGPDIDAIVEARNCWTVFRCTPLISSTLCPTTARTNIKHLELSLMSYDHWDNWTRFWFEDNPQQPYLPVVAKLQEITRDKLLAITQSFFLEALDSHKAGTHLTSGNLSPVCAASHPRYILLPPKTTLESLLSSYSNSFELYYPITARGFLDPNELMFSHNERTTALLILMMIAHGALTISSIEARWLTGGLTEICRISLSDFAGRNIIVGDAMVLQAALLFTVLAAWSGDKWQMDFAMSQRGLYYWMVQHSGMLEAQPVTTTQMIDNAGRDALWRDWLQKESRSRWVARVPFKHGALPNICQSHLLLDHHRSRFIPFPRHPCTFLCDRVLCSFTRLRLPVACTNSVRVVRNIFPEAWVFRQAL